MPILSGKVYFLITAINGLLEKIDISTAKKYYPLLNACLSQLTYLPQYLNFLIMGDYINSYHLFLCVPTLREIPVAE